MKDRHLTVVYTINDKDAFQPELQRIMENNKPSDGEPWALTAWSRDHEITRMEFIEQALDENDIDLARDIISMIDIGDFKSLDEIRDSA